MKRALILFTGESIDGKKAFPDALKVLIEQASEGELAVDTAIYDELMYILSPGVMAVRVSTTGRDVAEYDVVYARRIKESTAQSIAVGKYCNAKGVAFIDDEIAARPGSMGKLTQYLQFAIAGVPFPRTVYSSAHSLLLRAFDINPMEYPVILKSVSGTRGGDNYLVTSRKELEDRLSVQPEVHFLIQEYVPNTSDYRVWVCGNEIGPVLYRTRSAGHTNNTSQGGSAKLLDVSVLPAEVVADCIKAARLLQRDVAGVDVVFHDDNLQGRYYFFEVNRAPQIEGTPYEEVKAKALADYMLRRAGDSP